MSTIVPSQDPSWDRAEAFTMPPFCAERIQGKAALNYCKESMKGLGCLFCVPQKIAPPHTPCVRKGERMLPCCYKKSKCSFALH